MTSSREDAPDGADAAAGSQRLDKWLWFARVSKSRTLGAGLVTEGKVRVNRTRATKPSQSVRPGDVLTIVTRGKVQVLKVLAPGARRGPPAEARLLYESLTPVAPAVPSAGKAAAPARDQGAGRPTKRDRRMLDRLDEAD